MEEVVEVFNVSKKFGSVTALDNVSLTVEKNTIFGLLGSNGAGKTTLLHIITGLLNPSNGEINIFGERVTKEYSKKLKKIVAIVPQKISLYDDLTIYENLYFFGSAYALKKEDILKKIKDFKNMLKLGDLNRKIKNLSGGYQRRVSLAIGLIGNPQLLILDEALVGIDLETKNIITNLLLNLKKNITIIITTHAIKEAEEICDYICFLHKGKKVLDGKMSYIIRKYASKYHGRISIKFKDANIAERIFKNFKNYKSIELQKDTIHIETLCGDYNASVLVNFIKKIKKYGGYIDDINIYKPSLEEVMLNFIKSD